MFNKILSTPAALLFLLASPAVHADEANSAHFSVGANMTNGGNNITGLHQGAEIEATLAHNQALMRGRLGLQINQQDETQVNGSFIAKIRLNSKSTLDPGFFKNGISLRWCGIDINATQPGQLEWPTLQAAPLNWELAQHYNTGEVAIATHATMIDISHNKRENNQGLLAGIRFLYNQSLGQAFVFDIQSEAGIMNGMNANYSDNVQRLSEVQGVGSDGKYLSLQCGATFKLNKKTALRLSALYDRKKYKALNGESLNYDDHGSIIRDQVKESSYDLENTLIRAGVNYEFETP